MQPLGFFGRLKLALKVLGDEALALVVQKRVVGEEPAPPAQLPPPSAQAAPTVVPTPTPTPEPAPPVVEKKPASPFDEHAAALHLLSILQRDGRFVDFLQEDVAGFSDAEVGAAARVVHEGCRKAFKQYFTLQPVRKEQEGAPVVVEKGFDPASIRLSGNVTGEPPFKGKLAHAGWKVAALNLPARPSSIDPSIVAPAEVEL